MEHGLGGVQLRDGGEDTTSVTGEEDDVGGVVRRYARDLCVLDELDGVGTAGVLGESDIVVVDVAGYWVEDNVLKHGAELDGVEDIRLLLCGETNALGVALLNVSNRNTERIQEYIHHPRC